MQERYVLIWVNVLRWKLDQTPEEKIGKELKELMIGWFNDNEQMTPTFRQLEEFSEKSGMPLGCFILSENPFEENDNLEDLPAEIDGIYYEGMQRGEDKKAREIAVALRRRGFSAEEIAEITDYKVETVKEWLSKETLTKWKARKMPYSFRRVFID